MEACFDINITFLDKISNDMPINNIDLSFDQIKSLLDYHVSKLTSSIQDDAIHSVETMYAEDTVSPNNIAASVKQVVKVNKLFKKQYEILAEFVSY